MKLASSQIPTFLKAPDPAALAVLVYGPDQGLVRERAEILCRSVVDDLKDAFRVAVVGAEDLAGDPARLADEAAQMSLMGGRRVVWVREAGNRVASVFQSFLADPMGEALIVVEGGNLGPRDRLRTVFEGAKNAAAIPCYADRDSDIARLVTSALSDAGLRIDRDALVLLTGNLGADRQVNRRELEKLILYKAGDSATVTIADVRAVTGDNAAVSLDDVVYACADGNPAALLKALNRAMAEGAVSVQILRAAGNHFHRLHRVACALGGAEPGERHLAKLRPPIHFTRKADFLRQLRRWPPARLASAIERLLAAEIECKTTGNPERAICERTLLSLAAAARRDDNAPAAGRAGR